MDKQSQITGSLLGLAYGDVLGCPTENWTESEIMAVYGHLNSFPQSYNYGRIKSQTKRQVSRLRPLGLHSDDTQQALALLNVCLSRGGWTKSKWADILVNGHNNRAWRGTGPKFREAVVAMADSLKQGQSPEGKGSKSAGIGAAMRTAPLGGLYHDNMTGMKKVALESAQMTHADVRAMAIAYAVAFVSYSFINGQTPTKIRGVLADHLFEIEKEICQDYILDLNNMHAVSQGFDALIRRHMSSIPDLRVGIAEYAKPLLHVGHALHPNDGFTLLGGLHAVVLCLLDDVNPRDVLFDVIRLGDDTDTIAAIAGGILGARFGTEWIEQNILTDKVKIDRYAKAMVTKSSVESMYDLVTHEKKLTETEIDFQKKNERQYS